MLTPNAATQGGVSVIIDGTNFGPGSTVSFNGTEAEVRYLNPTRLKMRVPAGATSGFVTVTTGSFSAQSSLPFDVLPRFRTFLPKTTYRGGPVTITGTGLTGTTAVMFGSVSADFTLVDDTTITTFFPVGADTDVVTIVKPEGTSGARTGRRPAARAPATTA